VKLAAKGHLLAVVVLVGVLEIVEEVFEQVDALLGQVAHLEDGAHDLALHLPVNKNNVFLVVDDVSDFRAQFPNLRP
jgi:hypothetical protein